MTPYIAFGKKISMGIFYSIHLIFIGLRHGIPFSE